MKTLKSTPNRTRAKITAQRQAQIAERIRLLRKAKRPKLTAQDLAKAAGIDPATMSQIETVKRNPDLATVLSLAEQLGVQPGAILDEPTAAAPQHDTPSLVDLVATIGAALSHWAAEQRK